LFLVKKHVSGHRGHGTAEKRVHLQLVDDGDRLVVELEPAVVVADETDVVAELEALVKRVIKS